MEKKTLNERVAKAVRKWCKAKKMKLVDMPRHVHARAYVVGKVSAFTLVVSAPWVDSEPQCQTNDKERPLSLINTFDESLEAGDWCSTAYVVHGGVQETVAIPVVA
jgi:hypothetical protein